MRSLETFDLSAAIVNVCLELKIMKIKFVASPVSWLGMIVCANAKSDAPESR